MPLSVPGYFSQQRNGALEFAVPGYIMFWGSPGDEPTLIKFASTYELASKHRAPPPDFPALADAP